MQNKIKTTYETRVKYLEEFEEKYKEEINNIETIRQKALNEIKHRNIALGIIFILITIALIIIGIKIKYPSLGFAIAVLLGSIFLNISNSTKIYPKLDDKREELVLEYISQNILELNKIINTTSREENTASIIITNIFTEEETPKFSNIYIGNYNNIDFEMYNTAIEKYNTPTVFATIYKIKCNSEYKNVNFSKTNNENIIPRELINIIYSIEETQDCAHLFDNEGNLLIKVKRELFFSFSELEETAIASVINLDCIVDHIYFIREIIDTYNSLEKNK